MMHRTLAGANREAAADRFGDIVFCAVIAVTADVP
jgi:hypothetical protein